MKRFWDDAAVFPAAGGFQVALDGRPVRLPGGAVLHLPGRALAEAVVAEWQAAGGGKGGEMGWHEVPLTRLAGTAQERVAPDPGPLVSELARYGESDLLCYRAEGPAALVQHQHARWQPWLEWLAGETGARLRIAIGVMPVTQDAAALAALSRAVAAQPPYVLAALGVAVPALGSLVLGLAMAASRLDPGEAFSLATLDEAFQAGRWGHDEEAAERLRAISRDIAVAGRFLELVR